MNIDEIPVVFWMVVFGGLAFLFGLVLYYLALSLKESNNTMVEVTSAVKRTNKLLDETELILKDAREVTSEAKEMVTELNQSIMPPIRTFGSISNSFAGIVEGFKSAPMNPPVEDSVEEEEELDFSQIKK